MLDFAEDSLIHVVDHWLNDFEDALTRVDAAALSRLFLDECWWRDVLAFTWHIETVAGPGAIGQALVTKAVSVGAHAFRVDESRTPPRRKTRTGEEVVEAIFRFETHAGRGEGVVRLRPGAGGEMRAWTFATALRELKGHEEHVDHDRPKGEDYSRDFQGPNWLDLRNEARAYEDHDPAVLVVGGGQAGLSAAACLTNLGIDTLIVDREARIGDNWRRRYHALTLHNQVQVNHLPYMPFPPNWPTYIPKDKLANWFEAYVEAMELNFWTGTEFKGGSYDAAAGRWEVELAHADGETRRMRPRHIVMATGVSGIPVMPDIPSLGDFAGEVVHSGRYTDGEDWAGKNAIVLGTGNSGHDVAQDLCSAGAHVTMVQRSPTQVVSIEPSAQIPYALYDEGPPLADSDLLVTGTPWQLSRRSHIAMTEVMEKHDAALLDGLRNVGFKLDNGEDHSGWQFKYLDRGGGYYFNVGCSDMLIDGRIGLIQFDDLDGFVADGARLKDGEVLPADLLVCATGYRNQETLVERLFGDEVAARVGPIWGFDDSEPETCELRSMYARTGQPGLFFIGGSFAQCRINSKYLSLQIKAIEEGMIPASR